MGFGSGLMGSGIISMMNQHQTQTKQLGMVSTLQNYFYIFTFKFRFFDNMYRFFLFQTTNTPTNMQINITTLMIQNPNKQLILLMKQPLRLGNSSMKKFKNSSTVFLIAMSSGTLTMKLNQSQKGHWLKLGMISNICLLNQ